MRILTVTLAVALLGISNSVFGAANVAQVPVGLRQSYADGSSTEISCALAARSPDGCVFHVKRKNRGESYTVRASAYRIELYISEYWYWPGMGNAFSLALPIACPEEQLALLSSDARSSAECRLFLSPSRDALVPERLQILRTNGAPLYIELGPNNSSKPKPLRGSA